MLLAWTTHLPPKDTASKPLASARHRPLTHPPSYPKAFGTAPRSAAILISQAAHAQNIGDGGPQAEQTAEQRATADANAAKLKEGAAKVFSFGKGLFNQGVDAAKAGANTISEKAQAIQASQAAPANTASAPQDGAAHAASSPSLAKQASDLSNSQGGKIAKQVLGGLIPGGSKVLDVGGKILDAKAKSDAKASAPNGASAPAVQAQASAGDNVTHSVSGANLVKTGLSFGSGLLDKLKAKRAEAAPAASADNSPSP